MDPHNRKSFVRFCLVGALNTAIDFGVFLALHRVFGWEPVPSHVTGFALAVVNSYVLNKYWSFGDASAPTVAQAARFVAVAMAGLVLTTLIVWGLAGIIGAVPAKIAAIAVGLVWNYCGSRRLVFRR